MCVYPVVGPLPLADHRLPAANPAGLVSENESGIHPCRMDLMSLMQPRAATTLNLPDVTKSLRYLRFLGVKEAGADRHGN